MTRSKWFLLEDRVLEVRDLRVMTSLEIWIYESDRPVGRHSVLSLRDAASALAQGRDMLGEAMEQAIVDVQAARFPSPGVRHGSQAAAQA
jgi:hypothetical protein